MSQNNTGNGTTTLTLYPQKLLNPLSDYISTSNIFDMFSFFEDNKYKEFPLHSLLNNGNSYINLNELSLISINPLLTNSFNISTNSFFLNNNTMLTQFEPLFQSFADDIQKHSILNNNIDELNEIFPEKSIQFEYFEFSSSESDMSTYEVLSTPETKIFYPEPFIASPSFVHEDL